MLQIAAAKNAVATALLQLRTVQGSCRVATTTGPRAQCSQHRKIRPRTSALLGLCWNRASRVRSV